MNINKKIFHEIQDLGAIKNIGSSIRPEYAYHGLPFEDIQLKIHRKNLARRVALILAHYDPKNKTGIDLGCNIGGFVFALQLRGAKMVGYDYDAASVELAKKIEKYKKTGARFVEAVITNSILLDFESIDFCLWLSQFMWLVKSIGQQESLEFMWLLSQKIKDVMFFETSFKDSMAGKTMEEMGIINSLAVLNLLIDNTCFTKIKDLGYFEDGWSHRPVFLCSEPTTKWRSTTAIVERIAPEVIKKTCDERIMETFSLLKCKSDEVQFLRRLNSEHFPKVLNDISANEFTMEYCGIPLNKDNMPENYKDQMKEILNQLQLTGITHRDIRPANLLVRNNIIKLIDFGWSSEKGHEMENFPKGLGWDFRPDFPAPATRFDDKYSLKKSIDHILNNE